jgi:hypothetical protein
LSSASQQYVEVTGLPDLNAQVTVACWARSDTPAWNVAGCLVSRRPQWVLHPWLNPPEDKRVSFLVFDSSNTQRTADLNLSTVTGFDLTEWHHYAGSYDSASGQIKLYVDGVLANTTAMASGLLQASTGPLGFGKDYTGTRYFGGALDEIRLYDRVLDGGEILALTAGFDDDQDGMADEVERQIINFNPGDGLHTLADVLPWDDFDGDGVRNGDEAVAGTDATSALDFFRIVNVDASGSETPFSVFVDGRVGRGYELERSFSPGGPWQVVDQVGPLATDELVELVEPVLTNTSVFYRARVIRAP